MDNRDYVVAYLYKKLAAAPALAKNSTQKNGEAFRRRTVYFSVQDYANKFLNGEETGIENRIIVLPGLRGVGKTTILLQLYTYLTSEKHIPQERVLYFSADESTEYMGAQISDVIGVYLEDVLKTPLTDLDAPLFILIDEAHYDKNWGLSAKVVYDQTKKIFLLLTGSSALSLEQNVDLARRRKKEAAYPLNLSEYLLLKYNVASSKYVTSSIERLLFSPADDSLSTAKKRWDELRRDMLLIGRPLEKEFEYFLSSGGFPFSINLDDESTYEKIINIIDRIVLKDIPEIRSFKTETIHDIKRIIIFLAMQKPGEIATHGLANLLQISSNKVRDILEVLEQTHLVFSVKPYGGTKISKKAWKYYFSHPSINAAIRSTLGMYTSNERHMLGAFAETFVASSLFRMMRTIKMPTGIFYDSHKGGTDFLIKTELGKLIPIEVGIGEKDDKQVKGAIQGYNADYGILLSNINEVSIDKDGRIIHMPLTFFSFA